MERHHFLGQIRKIAIALAIAVVLLVRQDVSDATVTEVLPEQSLTAKPEAQEEESVLEIHFMDVGQGDATLLMCDGEYMLIDAGDGTKGTFVQNYLQKRGVATLKYLVLTHPDADHIGAAAVVVTKFSIENIFMSDFRKENKTYEQLLDAIDNKGYTWSVPAVGDTYTLGHAVITVIAPGETYEEPNNASLGLLVTHGENTFLFTGDAEEKAEKDILDNGINISAKVYHVGHHGSKTSSSDAFLQAVNPDYAVISCGAENSYGHPHAEVLNRLRGMKIQMFRTDEQGSIVVTSDENSLIWSVPPSESWQSGQ